MFNLDSIKNNADWTKMIWDLPGYKSKRFMDLLKASGITLTEFKKLPVYKWAVKSGKIKE